MRPTLAFVFNVDFVLYYISAYWRMAAFVVLGLVSSVPFWVIGWEESLLNDPILLDVELDVNWLSFKYT